MFKQKKLVSAIVCSSLALTACNSNDDDNVGASSKAVTTTTITVTPSLGKILNGRVTLKNAKTGVALAPTQTLTPTSNGTATFTVPVSQIAEPVLAEVLPTTAGVLEYADEALNKAAKITVPSADINKPVLRTAATVTPNANIGVTALTESAVQQAEKQVGGLIAQNINSANAAVKNALKLNFDITQAPVVVGVNEFSKLIDAALDAQRRAYATYLATLAKEAQRINSASATPALDMAKAFANDYSHDGVFNAVGSQALAINYSMSFLNAWMQWVQNFYSQFLKLNNLEALNQWYAGFNVTQPNGGTPTPAVPIRTVDGVEEYACSAAANLRSTSPALPIQINFVNQLSTNISTHWINGNGGIEPYNAVGGRNFAPIAANANFNQGTYTNHPWIIRDNIGSCLSILKAITQTNKTLTFKADGSVMIGTGIPAEETKTPATVNAGLVKSYTLKYNLTQNGGAYTNGQTLAANVSSAGDLVLGGFVLKNPYYDKVNGVDFTGEVIWKDGNLKYALSNNTTGVFNEINVYDTNKTPQFLGQFVLSVETCASKNLPRATLSSMTDYNGDYKSQIGDIVFNLNTNTAKATVKGTEANISEVCGPTNLNSGTNHVLITNKGNVTLFKTTAGVYSAEGQEFADKTKVFYGEKAKIVSNNCSSTGNDTKLGFRNAPSDFCSFSYTYGTSTALSSPDIYTFKDATDPMANAKVTVLNGSVQTFQLENSKYAYACGAGGMPSCVGITIPSNTNTNIEFKFANVQVANVDPTKSGMIIDSGLLMHKKAVQTTNGINLSACNTLVGTAGIQCGAQVVADFNLTLRNSVTNGSCQVSKSGNTITAESGQFFASATLNNEDADTAFVNDNGRGVTAQNLINGNNQSINVTYSNTGVLTSIFAAKGQSTLSCVPNSQTLSATGTASGIVTNVQYNKDGTLTGGKGELRANSYEFSGNLNSSFTLKVKDTIQNLRYDLIGTNGKFTTVNLYSLTNSASPLFVYTCDSTGDTSCLGKVTLTMGSPSTLVFSNMKFRGVFQSQYDAIMNGQVTLNP